LSAFIVGLTGGIGSGKTAVSDRFKTHGITVVDADVVSREVVAIGSPCLEKIHQHFSADILLDDGTLNRAKLREKIFANAEDKQWLESLLHPAIANETARQIGEAKSDYVLFVSPLLVEAGQDAMCNRLLVVDVPVETQVSRTVSRDNNSAEQVQRIIASQASREQRTEKADDIIVNDKSLAELQEATDALHHRYLDLAKQHHELKAASRKEGAR